MNNPFAMDQAEKVGLGAALGGHAFLLALLLAGLFQATRSSGPDGGGSGDGLAVSIVSESGAPAPAAAPAVEAKPVVEQAEVLPEATVDPSPVPKPVQKVPPKPNPVNKATPKPLPKTQSKAGTGRGGSTSSDFDRRMEEKLKGMGGGTGSAPKKGAGEGTGTGASTQTAAQIRTKTSNTIAAEVRPYIPGCAPVTSDKSSLRVFVALNIGPAANLTSASVYDVQGITPGNQAQVERMKKCVLDSLRAASPYNLDPEQYDMWRNHRVQLKVNFK
jgi:periplasmic protein TonB